MATTGDHLGNLRLMYVDDVAIGCTTSMSLSLSSESVDSTCKDNNGARQSLAGQQNWSVSIAGNQVFENTVSVDDLVTLWKNRTEFECKLSTNVTGDVEYTGDAYIESMEIVDNVNEVATWTANVVGTGPITAATIA
jgi:predicted secreted protein